MEEEPLEQPQLYDGTVLEADADGDIVIPPAPVANDEAPPAHVDPAPDAEGGDPDDSSDDSGGDDRIDILARVTASLNTNLKGATTEMDMYHEELQAAQAKIARLEAQLAGQRLPQEVVSYHTTASPPHKRLRYGTAEATTRLG
jgi:hypothetical protein